MTVLVDNAKDLKTGYNDDVIIACNIDMPNHNLTINGRLTCLDTVVIRNLYVAEDVKTFNLLHTCGSFEAVNLDTTDRVIVEGNFSIRGAAEVRDLIVYGDAILEFYLGGLNVNVKGNLIVTDSVEVAYDLIVGKNASISEYLHAGTTVFVGGTLTAKYIVSDHYDITCKELKTSEILPVTSYWAAFPPFNEWKNSLSNGEISCTRLRKMLNEEEMDKIISWEGWHPLQRAQLKMFFGKCTSVPGEELVVK